MRARIADELVWQAPSGLRSVEARVIDREINTAIKHYETTRVSWTEVRGSPIKATATTSGTRYYSLTANFLKVDTLKLQYNDSFVMMNFRTWLQIEEDDRQITATEGVPQDYAIHAREVRVFPVPNGAYTFDGSWVQSTTVLSANTDTNGWMVEGEELIRARTRAVLETNYLKLPEAVMEKNAYAARKQPFFSAQEEIAFKSLKDETSELMSTGKLKPYYV